MVVTTLISGLMETGLSEYEARAYLGLLGSHPATAYEVAKASGIPTSKIYEVLAKLEEKGITSVLEGEKGKKTYAPLEPAEFIESRRRMIRSTLGQIEQGLQALGKGADTSYIWNITDYGHLMDKAARIIERARESVLMSTWADEFGRLAHAVSAAEARGVRAAAVHFGPVDTEAGMLYPHPIQGTIYAEKGGRGLVVVGDNREALVGTVRKNLTEGAFSTNRGFVTLAEDYIKHDIYVMKIVRRFDRQLTRAFGLRYEKLRDVFTDEDKL